MIEIEPNAPIASLRKAGAKCSLPQVHEGRPFRSVGKTRDYMDTANFPADERIREIAHRVIIGGGAIAIEGADISYALMARA